MKPILESLRQEPEQESYFIFQELMRKFKIPYPYVQYV